MSVYKRKSGRYAVLIDLDPTATGLRRRKSIGTYRTRKEAESAERRALEARDRGIDLSPRTLTVAHLLERFIADRRAKGRALRTVQRYEELAKFSISKLTGSLTLAKLTPAHISAWLILLQQEGSASGKPLSAKSVKHAFDLLRAALRWAVRHDLVGRNVCDAIDAPSVPRSSARAIDENEAVRFLAVADETRWGPFFRLALGTGARRGELLALRWTDVCIPDVGQPTVAVRRAFVEAKGSGIVEKVTKTDRERLVPLGGLAVEALRRQRKLQAEERLAAGGLFSDTGHVFQAPGGGPVAPFLATEAFRTLRTQVGLNATLHDLRHSAASWMLAAGVNVASVARILGHSTPTTTLAIYAHAMPSDESHAVATIDERLSRARAK
jgi:integrase